MLRAAFVEPAEEEMPASVASPQLVEHDETEASALLKENVDVAMDQTVPAQEPTPKIESSGDV